MAARVRPGRRRSLWMLAFATALACGETKYEVFLQALEAEGEAERGPCKLHYADTAASANFMSAATLSGDQIASCIAATDRALALFEKAASMGQPDAELQQAHERAKARKDKLSSMLRMVRQMERDALRPPGH